MTNTQIKITLEKILLRNNKRSFNNLIPSDILDIKDIIKQLILSGVSQQRKLLQCFCNLANITHDTVDKDIEEAITLYNNCN
jgi:hypothetical protein